MPIPAYDELAGSGRTQHDADNGNGGERLFLTYWGDRYDFAEAIAGQPYPGVPWAYCRQIAVEPFSAELCPDAAALADPNSQIVTYSQNGGKVALVRASYATDYANAPWPCEIPEPGHTASTRLQLRVRGTAQFLTLPANSTRWDDNQGGYAAGRLPGPDDNVRLIIPITEFHVEWLYVDEPPANLLRDTQGSVNDAAFLGHEAETVLFESYDIGTMSQFVPSDPFAWKVTCMFRARRIKVGANIYGWNHEYRDDGWQRVWMREPGGGLVRRYPQADLSGLFYETSCI